jgi:hypothetical protein
MATEMDGSISRENPIREVWRWDSMWATTLAALQVEDAPSGAWMPGAEAAAGGPTSDLISSSSSSSTVCFFFGRLAAAASYVAAASSSAF